jgi:hypothetical protein
LDSQKEDYEVFQQARQGHSEQAGNKKPTSLFASSSCCSLNAIIQLYLITIPKFKTTVFYLWYCSSFDRIP